MEPNTRDASFKAGSRPRCLGTLKQPCRSHSRNRGYPSRSTKASFHKVNWNQNAGTRETSGRQYVLCSVSRLLLLEPRRAWHADKLQSCLHLQLCSLHNALFCAHTTIGARETMQSRHCARMKLSRYKRAGLSSGLRFCIESVLDRSRKEERGGVRAGRAGGD